MHKHDHGVLSMQSDAKGRRCPVPHEQLLQEPTSFPALCLARHGCLRPTLHRKLHAAGQGAGRGKGHQLGAAHPSAAPRRRLHDDANLLGRRPKEALQALHKKECDRYSFLSFKHIKSGKASKGSPPEGSRGVGDGLGLQRPCIRGRHTRWGCNGAPRRRAERYSFCSGRDFM